MVKRKVTAADVARASAVSPATVDRVLNGRGGVGIEKERRVLECAVRLGLDRNLRLRPTRTIRIAALIGPRSNPFFESMRLAFGRANRLFFASNIQISVHHLDILAPSEMVRGMEHAAQSADALIAVAPSHPGVQDALTRLAARKPLVTIVSDLPETGRLVYVGIDNLAAGRVAGDLMARFIGPAGGDVVIVSDLQNLLALKQRETGFRAVLAERHRSCRLAGVAETTGDRDRAAAYVQAVARERPDLAGVYLVSTGSSAIASLLRTLDLKTKVTMITHELTPQRRDFLREGTVDAIIDQNPEVQVLSAVEFLAHHYGRLEALPPRLLTPFTLYFRENC